MKRKLAAVAILVALFIAPAPFAQGISAPGPADGRALRPAQGQARASGERAGTAIVRGRIVAATTGMPVRRAQVRAVAASSRGSRLVTTGDDGSFEIRDLPAGRWELTASKAGFVTMRFGQRRAFEAGRPLEVSDGQVIETVDFFLPRGAAITGRVFDEFGDPVAGARIQSLRYQLVQGTRRLMPVGMTTQTDDTGAFRVFGLMPGEYYVSAVLRALPLDDPGDTTSYAPTYYPGTGSVTQAQPVAIGIGDEVSISFGLMPVRTARISGTVLSSTGMPLANGSVRLHAADAAGGIPAAFGSGTRIVADGTFTLANVAPGSYTVIAVSSARRASGPELEMGSATISVAGDDLTGVVVVTGHGATLAGTVAVASGGGTLPAANLRMTAPSIGFNGDVGVRPASVGRDGTFTLTNLFGPRLVRLSGLPPEWMLEAVIVGGRDVTDQPIDFGHGLQMVDARVVITNRITEVTGTVTQADGRPSSDFAVVVFPDDESKWTAPSRYLRSARPDQQGLFRIRALPPGDRYLAVAVDYLEDGEGSDPEFLRIVKSRATPFRMSPGESVVVNLRVVER